MAQANAIDKDQDHVNDVEDYAEDNNIIEIPHDTSGPHARLDAKQLPQRMHVNCTNDDLDSCESKLSDPFDNGVSCRPLLTHTPVPSVPCRNDDDPIRDDDERTDDTDKPKHLVPKVVVFCNEVKARVKHK